MSSSSSSRPLARCVALFDIDGTLVNGPKRRPSPGTLAMGDSALALTGKQGLHRAVGFAGRTDLEIAENILKAGGIDAPSPSQVADLLDRYVQRLERQLHQAPYQAIPGAREAVEAVRDAGAVVGLGTGNLRRGAAAKLKSAGLDDLFDMNMGGYGDDGKSRDQIILAGQQRCDPSGARITVIIGDTPRDIEAARRVGLRSCAVATGLYTVEQLEQTGADAVLKTLNSELVTTLTRILSGPLNRERED